MDSGGDLDTSAHDEEAGAVTYIEVEEHIHPNHKLELVPNESSPNNLICRSCGQSIDFNSTERDEIGAISDCSHPYHVECLKVEVERFGICVECYRQIRWFGKDVHSETNYTKVNISRTVAVNDDAVVVILSDGDDDDGDESDESVDSNSDGNDTDKENDVEKNNAVVALSDSD